ncbi:MAG: hypothetical protein PGN13_04475 [Patulibacter minatonensis]
MSMSPKPTKRVTALATLAFASAVTGGAAGNTTTANAAQSRTNQQPPRSTTRPAGEYEPRPASDNGRLTLPPELDVDAFAAELGVHPGRLAAALRKLAPDETRSVGGLDPLTALARELELPATDVYLAAARQAARLSRG